MRLTIAILAAAAMFVVAGATSPDPARADPTVSAVKVAPATDISAQRRKRRPRVYIYRNEDDRGVYPRYFPGRYAVRDCTANLVQEFRPSGTVIVPRTSCYWRQP